MADNSLASDDRFLKGNKKAKDEIFVIMRLVRLKEKRFKIQQT